MEGSTVSLLILSPLLAGAAALLLGLLKLRLTAGLTAALLLLFGLFHALRGALALLTQATGEGVFSITAGGWLEGIGIVLRYSGESAALITVIYAVGLLVLLHAMAEGERRPVFFGVYAIALTGMIGVAVSADLFNLFVFFEVLSLSAAILIAYDRTLRAMQAAFRYLLVATLSISLYLLGLFVLYRSTGELSFDAVERGLATEGALAATLAGALIFSALATRVALVPFHGWLPEAHGEAPTPVSALLSGLMLKAGFLAFWHVLQLFPSTRPLELLGWIGAFSAVIGALAALFQEDAKRLLAFSSISQLGYIAAAAGSGAFLASFYHLLSHAFYKTLLFLLVGYWVHRWGCRDIDELRRRRSAGSIWRRGEGIRTVLLLLAVSAIIGIPPFSAFVSKGLMGVMMKGSAVYPPVYPLIQVAGVFTAAAMLKLFTLAVPLAGGRQPDDADLSGPAKQSAAGANGNARGKGDRAAGVISLGLLVVVFLPTFLLGAFPGRVVGLLIGLGIGFPSTAAKVEGIDLYTTGRLVGSIWPVLLGVLLLLLLRSAPGRWALRGARRLRLGVDGAMVMVALGSVGVALAYLL